MTTKTRTDTPEETPDPGPADPAPASNGSNWGELLAQASFDDKEIRPGRGEVAVPPEVQDFVNRLAANPGKVGRIPVKGVEAYLDLKRHCQNAAYAIPGERKFSATCREITEADGDAVKLVGLRVSLGDRRGTKHTAVR